MKMKAFKSYQWVSRSECEDFVVPIGRCGRKMWDRRIFIDPDGYSEEAIARRFKIVKEPFLFPAFIRKIAVKVRNMCDFICTR